MMLAFGRHRLVVRTIDVSGGNDDCDEAADVGEGLLTLLLDVSSPPSPVVLSRCDDDDLSYNWRCRCCFQRRMSAMMSAVVRTASGGRVVCCCSSGHGCDCCSLLLSRPILLVNGM